MPRLTKLLPKYRRHRASGQAVVTLNGQDFYLGTHGTKASRKEYDRLVGECQANGRTLTAARESMTVTEEISLPAATEELVSPGPASTGSSLSWQYN